MKRTLIIIGTLLAHLSVFAQTPEWVKSRPISDKEYIGIGMCPVSDIDYIKKATQNALADISSQISLKLDNKSFLHVIDIDSKSREMLEDKITSSITTWLEGQKLIDTYIHDNVYYVYYSLDKNTYLTNVRNKRRNIINTGWEYLQKGMAAEESMQLVQAAHLYGKGLEELEPWVFMDLIHTGDNSETNIPVELYNKYFNLFSNLTITTNIAHVEGEAFKPISEPIAGCLSKNGTVIPNIRLKALFVSGSGSISEAIETDYNGTSEFYITNITSKAPVQEIRISIDESTFESLPKAYRQMLKKQNMPSAKITVELKNAPVTCYLTVNNKNDLEGIESRIGSLMTNNYFTITEDKDAAEYYMDLYTKLEGGSVVTGGTYNMNSHYCTLILKIYDNHTQNLLLNYSINQQKVLTPVHHSSSETISMCNREIMKRVNKELPELLKKLNKN